MESCRLEMGEREREKGLTLCLAMSRVKSDTLWKTSLLPQIRDDFHWCNTEYTKQFCFDGLNSRGKIAGYNSIFYSLEESGEPLAGGLGSPRSLDPWITSLESRSGQRALSEVCPPCPYLSGSPGTFHSNGICANRTADKTLSIPRF